MQNKQKFYQNTKRNKKKSKKYFNIHPVCTQHSECHFDILNA